ncbi:MAG: family 20 glycosylhydrolase [Adhaeribacter sp.]
MTLLLLAGRAAGQPAGSRFDPAKLQLSWEVLQNQYQGKTQVLTALTLANTGSEAFPARGWQIYYNSGRSVAPVLSGELTFRHVNGDLNRIVPGAGFASIPAGGSHRATFVVSSRALNQSDIPSGFYLVWDNNPEKGWPLPALRILPLAAKAQTGTPMTPERLYRLNAASLPLPAAQLPPVFPSPQSYQATGTGFRLHAGIPIQADAPFKREAQLLAADLAGLLGRQPATVAATTAPAIRLEEDKSLGPEAYQLQVSSQGIRIRAAAGAGAFYGIQSLKTLVPPQAWQGPQQSLELPGLELADSPRFAYRAFMMDVARNFQPKQQVLRILDLMALYKLNVLHFHLNDDEGWRLEIPALPELTQVGGRRGHAGHNKKQLPPSYGSGPDTGRLPGSGFYSRQDFIEILRYARDRHIRVIPEVETPGHARAAIKAMDARYDKLMAQGRKAEAERYLLRDLQDKSVYRSVQKWNDNVMNVALPSTYVFIEKVVDEILAMYREAEAPISTIHLGGDEVPAGVWQQSPAVAELIKKNPDLANVDDLWYYYFGKVNQLLQARKLYLSGWEEVAMRKVRQGSKHSYIPNPDFVKENFHAYVWNNVWGWGSEDLAYRLANAGYKVVLAPVTNNYLDMAYYQDFDEPGLYWGSFIDVDKPFYFVPLDYYKSAREDLQGKPLAPAALAGKERLTETGKANIVGLQALLWSETVKSPQRQEYMLLPKLLGFAERAWAADPDWALEKDAKKSEALYAQAWARFVNVLGQRELPRLDHYRGGYGYRLPQPGALVENGQVKANVQLPGLLIRYTTDGSEPKATSPLYEGPVSTKGTIKLKVFSPGGRGGKTTTVENR